MDLPAPLGPTTARNSPGITSRSTPASATTPCRPRGRPCTRGGGARARPRLPAGSALALTTFSVTRLPRRTPVTDARGGREDSASAIAVAPRIAASANPERRPVHQEHGRGTRPRDSDRRTASSGGATGSPGRGRRRPRTPGAAPARGRASGRSVRGGPHRPERGELVVTAALGEVQPGRDPHHHESGAPRRRHEVHPQREALWELREEPLDRAPSGPPLRGP